MKDFQPITTQSAVATFQDYLTRLLNCATTERAIRLFNAKHYFKNRLAKSGYTPDQIINLEDQAMIRNYTTTCTGSFSLKITRS